MENNNSIQLTGKLVEAPAYAFDDGCKGWYSAMIDVPRLSNAVDRIPVLLPESQLKKPLKAGDSVRVHGDVRTNNYLRDNGSTKLAINIRAEKLLDADDRENNNLVRIIGNICKAPAFHVSPFGREITDMMIAVTAEPGHTDFIPAVAFGSVARWSQHLATGDRVQILGRMQSRPYIKRFEDGSCEDRVAYEVTVMRMSKADCWVEGRAYG